MRLNFERVNEQKDSGEKNYRNLSHVERGRVIVRMPTLVLLLLLTSLKVGGGAMVFPSVVESDSDWREVTGVCTSSGHEYSHIIPKEFLKDCKVGFSDTPGITVLPLQMIYPVGWYCRGRTFNQDLIMYRRSRVLDASLYTILMTYDFDSEKGIKDLDGECYHNDDDPWANGTYSLYNLNMYGDDNVGGGYLVAWCPLKAGAEPEKITYWANDTHYSNGAETWLIVGACSFSVEIVKPKGYGCDSYFDYEKFCSKVHEGVEPVSDQDFSCFALEYRYARSQGDDVVAELIKSTCSTSRRKLEYDDSCPGQRSCRKVETAVSTDGTSGLFHIHHRNAWDIRYYNKVPKQVWPEACTVIGNWNKYMISNNTAGFTYITTTVITCKGGINDPPKTNIGGGFIGIAKVSGTYESYGADNTCVHTSPPGYMRIETATGCVARKMAALPGSDTTLPATTTSYHKNGCSATPLSGTGPC